jgi:Xaa-Pro aminopeptidase
MRTNRILSTLLLLVIGAITAPAQQGGRYGHYDVYDTDLLPREEYAARRAKVLTEMDANGAMLLRSADVATRSNDVDYEFRQRNNLLYLTGVTEKESALRLVPHGVSINGATVREILFVSRRDPESEKWTGLTMGEKVAGEVTGIATVLPFSKLRSVLDDVLAGVSTIYYDGFLAGKMEEPLSGTRIDLEKESRRAVAEKFPRVRIRSAGEIIHQMRLVKSPAEIALMKRAVEISIDGHLSAIRAGHPGIHEYELEAIMEYEFRSRGAEDPGYPSIVGSGPNTCILHYETSRRQSQPGELVVMDCGAEYHGYSADITRTFPVDGKFTAEQRAIYDLVYEAQEAGIAKCVPGNSFFDPHREATRIIGEGLVRLGIIKLSSQASRYFPHGTSHWIGLDVHDVGGIGSLADGMLLTVEPGIYIPAGSPCDPKWWNIGVRIEDDILVTSSGPINLSARLPRRSVDIEAVMMEIRATTDERAN